jgi:hypothetical protein
LNLHGFHTGLERIFELVAATMDGDKPVGENWQKQLLQQMADEYPRLRPAVISEESSQRLSEFLSFRQIVRKGYTNKFDPTNIQKLITDVPDLFDQVKAEFLAFADFLYTADQKNPIAVNNPKFPL